MIDNEVLNRFDRIENRVTALESIAAEGLLVKGKPILCKNCGNTTNTKSKKLRITCSSCGYKIRIKELPKKKAKKDLLKCFKCKKAIKGEKIEAYDTIFHKGKCFNEFDRDAKKEVEKVTKEL